VKAPYFRPYFGKNFHTTKLLILGESAYNWRDDDGKVCSPLPSHPKESLLWNIKNFRRVRYFTQMSRALCGAKTPTLQQRKRAWNEYGYAIFIQGSVGFGARRRPSRRQFKDAGPHFLALIERIRPLKVIVTGKDLWNRMPETSVNRRDLGAYRLSDGTLVWCLAIPHPANSREGFNWAKISKSIRRFRSTKLPVSD
jgi:hypothetical protein